MKTGREDTDNTVQLTVALTSSSAHCCSSLSIAGRAD